MRRGVKTHEQFPAQEKTPHEEVENTQKGTQETSGYLSDTSKTNGSRRRHTEKYGLLNRQRNE